MGLYSYLIVLNYLISQYAIVFLELITIFSWIFFIKKFFLSPHTSAIFGLILLFVSAIFILFGADKVGGVISEFMLIFFFISAIQAFIAHLKNNEK